jgi:hypothetical protein
MEKGRFNAACEWRNGIEFEVCSQGLARRYRHPLIDYSSRCPQQQRATFPGRRRAGGRWQIAEARADGEDVEGAKAIESDSRGC